MLDESPLCFAMAFVVEVLLLPKMWLTILEPSERSTLFKKDAMFEVLSPLWSESALASDEAPLSVETFFCIPLISAGRAAPIADWTLLSSAPTVFAMVEIPPPESREAMEERLNSAILYHLSLIKFFLLGPLFADAD